MDTRTDDLFLAAEDVYQFGIDLGMSQVSTFIDQLTLTDDQYLSGFSDGVGDSGTTAAEGMGNSDLDAEFNPQVTFSAAGRDLLQQAADAIREEGRMEGAAVAVQAIRDWYDGLDDDLGKHYYEGVLYAHDQVVAAFSVDPQPRWEPYDPPEDPEDDE